MSEKEDILKQVRDALLGGNNVTLDNKTQAGDTGGNSQLLDVSNAKFVSFHIVWTGLDAADGVMKIQTSNDNETWEDAGVSHTLATAAGSQVIGLSNFAEKHIRVNWDEGANTAGTIKIFPHAKN